MRKEEPKTPEKRLDPKSGLLVTPTRWRVLNRLPSEEFYERLRAEVIPVCPDIGNEIISAIEKFYYPILERELTHTHFSIVGTIEQENRTGEGIKGKDHRIKAAVFYKIVESAIESAHFYQTQNPPLDILDILITFLTALNIKLAEELKAMPPKHKAIILATSKFDIDAIPDRRLDNKQRRIIKAINKTPVKNAGAKTPIKIHTDRMEAHIRLRKEMTAIEDDIEAAQSVRQQQRYHANWQVHEAEGLKRQAEVKQEHSSATLSEEDADPFLTGGLFDDDDAWLDDNTATLQAATELLAKEQGINLPPSNSVRVNLFALFQSKSTTKEQDKGAAAAVEPAGAGKAPKLGESAEE